MKSKKYRSKLKRLYALFCKFIPSVDYIEVPDNGEVFIKFVDKKTEIAMIVLTRGGKTLRKETNGEYFETHNLSELRSLLREL